MHTFPAYLPHPHPKDPGVLSRYNHRAHRETIIFHEINRVSAASPLCPLNYYSHLYHLLLKNNKATNSQNNDIFETKELNDGKFLSSRATNASLLLLETTEYLSGLSVVSYCSPIFHRSFDSTNPGKNS
jgi:hypothetical protein